MESQKLDNRCAKTIYVISESPIALARGRWSNGHCYDSQKNLRLVKEIGLKNQHEDRPLLTGPLHLIVTFFMPIPHKSKRQFNHHIFKPDLDNLIKWVSDLCSGIIFHDDCEISKITATKRYDYDPRTEFYFEVLE